MSKVLVVDDNPENRALATATLEDEDFDVVVAGSGSEGLAAFQAERPDCVLLDVRMPDLDGFEVCSRIRALPGGAETPVVFLTALRDVDTFDRALRAGGDDFLTKPVRPTELLVRVQSALKLRQMSTELREQYELVRRQRDDLMRLSLQKERLSAFVVHDLKNPVSAMDLQAQILLADASLPEHAREAARYIRGDARSLMRLILNLLDISKAEEGALSPRPSVVKLGALSDELLSGSELKATAAEIKLRLSLGVQEVRADPDLLRRTLENLLDNALRHAPRGSEIILSSAAGDGAVELRVTDAGPGIPPGLAERIFDPFVQVDEGERVVTRTGRGLGLAFCKVAVEAHGGTIWVEDASPGARFCLRLPQ